VFQWKEIVQTIVTWFAAVVHIVMANKYQLLALMFLLTIAVIIFSAMHGMAMHTVPLADTDPWPLKHHHG
jgi:ABC-type enterochelin transport system permease subunit